MLNHSCPGAVLQEGQALRNSNLGVAIQTDHTTVSLYSLLGMCVLSCSQAPLLTKVPMSFAVILSISVTTDRAL